MDTRKHSETEKSKPVSDPFAEEKEAERLEEIERQGSGNDLEMVACPEAGGMMVPAGECPSLPCYKGCPVYSD